MPEDHLKHFHIILVKYILYILKVENSTFLPICCHSDIQHVFPSHHMYKQKLGWSQGDLFLCPDIFPNVLLEKKKKCRISLKQHGKRGVNAASYEMTPAFLWWCNNAKRSLYEYFTLAWWRSTPYIDSFLTFSRKCISASAGIIPLMEDGQCYIISQMPYRLDYRHEIS